MNHKLKLNINLNAPILVSFIILLFCGCSLSSTRKTSQIDLTKYNTNLFTPIGNSQVYEFDSNQQAQSFVSAFEECGFSSKATAISTTRQLLIGFENLEIKNQAEVSINGNNVLKSLASAKLDDLIVNLVIFSVIQQNCVRDFVIWSSATSDLQDFNKKVEQFSIFIKTELVK